MSSLTPMTALPERKTTMRRSLGTSLDCLVVMALSAIALPEPAAARIQCHGNFQISKYGQGERSIMRLTGLRTAVIAALVALLPGNVDMAWAQPISPPGGQLKCDVEGGMSFFVGSSRRLDCVFTPTDSPPEFYKGSINKIGIDVGFQSRGVIVWAVLSPGLTRGPGSLSGNYVGASAEVVAGVGASANALVGGNKVVLNPLSVSGDVGLNVAGGIADIDLVYVGGPPPTLRGWVPFGAQ
ncbi:MAG: DUF992 domain-containing protein [Methyloceanibacter sp.]|jgi:hypothetical protein